LDLCNASSRLVALLRKAAPMKPQRRKAKRVRYEYEASTAGDGAWMVKRKHLDDGTWDEALLRDVPITSSKEEVIKAAIKRGSWA